MSVWEEIPKSGHLIPLSDPCLSLLNLSLPSSASVSFVSLTLVFLLERGPGNPGIATFHKLRPREGHCHQDLAPDGYSKSLRGRRHISGRCKVSWRFWEQDLRTEKSTPSDLLVLISFMWVVSVWDPNWRREDWASCSLLNPTPLFKSEAIGVKPSHPCLDSVCSWFRKQPRTYFQHWVSLVVCKKEEVMGLSRRLWCPLLLELRALREARLLVTLPCVSCLALIQPGTKDLILQAIIYGSGYFLSCKAIFITSKRGMKKGGKTL